MAKISISIPDEMLEKMDKERGDISRSKYLSNLIGGKSRNTQINIGFNLDDIEALLERKFEELKR